MNITKYLLVAVFSLTLLAGIVFNLNKTVPNVDFTALNGEQLSLEKLRGRPVLVTFWATDCDSCLKEIPLWLDLHDRYHAQGLEIIGVSMYYDPPNQVIEFNKLRPLPYRITLDIDAKFANAFGGVNVTPTAFLLNQKGDIVWQKVGLFELAELQPLIEDLLHER